MAADEDIAKLMAKGASIETALAALEATGSYHDAAEAIAAGIFGPVAVPSKTSKRNCKDDDDEDEDDHESEGGSLGGVSDAIIISDDEDGDNGGDRAMGMADQDPYSSINMKKNRKEKVIESIMPAKTLTIQAKETPVQKRLTPIECQELTANDWQRGVGHGSEQNFLFDVYKHLVYDDVTCPKPSCRKAYPRSGKEFLILFPTLASFLDHVQRNLSKQCTKCRTTFCLACGADWSEHVKAAKEAATKTQTTSRSHQASATNGDCAGTASATPNASWTLLHCPLSSSMVLGVGLAHVERLLNPDEPTSKESREDGDARKRRKVGDGHSTSATPSSATTAVTGAASAANPSGYYDDYYSPPQPGSKAAAAGTGYGGGGRGGTGDDYSWQNAAQQQQLQRDESIRTCLLQLRAYLPDERREWVHFDGKDFLTGPVCLDHLPDLSNLAHLRRRFLPIASTLLSTRSIMDVTERLPLFEELMTWMRMLSRHIATAPLVAQPIMRLQRTEIHGKERHNIYEGSPGPRELAQAVYDQAQVLVKNITKSDPPEPNNPSSNTRGATSPVKKTSAVDERTEEARRTLALCCSIIADVDAIDRSLIEIKGKGFLARFLSEIRGGAVELRDDDWDEDGNKVERQLSEDEMKDKYQTWARRLIYQEADMTSKVTGTSGSKSTTWAHTYAQEIELTRDLADSKRNLIIAKELAGLGPSLPADWHCAIFVRVAEARLDVLRACLSGPPSSPYANGLFNFDVFLPREYNQQPPKVTILTTDGGAVRFGPNLYAQGKVCLSLLGTWSGPGWSPGRSTLLQVLLSLSSLVMAEEEPAVNEPGWESWRGTDRSMHYTKNLRRQTVRHAMLRTLQNPPEPWEEVVKGHFRQKRGVIVNQLDDWLKEDDGYPTVGDGASVSYGYAQRPFNDNGFAKDVDSLKKLLDEL